MAENLLLTLTKLETPSKKLLTENLLTENYSISNVVRFSLLNSKSLLLDLDCAVAAITVPVKDTVTVEITWEQAH